MQEIILEVRDVSKAFPGVQALDSVSFDLRKGEILGLVGQNGAGKSTIVQIISGAYHLDSGTILIAGDAACIESPKHSLDCGISVVYQKLQLIDTMSVMENICLYDKVQTSLGLVDYRAMEEKARAILETLGVSIPLKALVKDLPPGVRQFVEIAKALSKGARVFILDEPTASLNEKEVEQLFKVLCTLREQGVGIMYVSHRFDEIFRITDRVTVLRNGKLVDTVETKTIDGRTLVQMVVGKTLEKQFPPRPQKTIGEPVLEVRGLCGDTTERIEDVSFELKKGEILGIYGLQYSGLQEIADILNGSVVPDSGKIVLHGAEVSFSDSHQAIEKGIAYMTNDRLAKGVFSIMTLRANETVSSLQKYLGNGFIHTLKEIESAKRYIEKLDIKATSTEQQAQLLSGGNQQKMMIARLLDTDADILILHEPTHGIDVGAKFEVYKLMLDLAAQGISIIFLSTEHEEILSLSDRIIIVNKGRIREVLTPDKTSVEDIHALAAL